MVGLDLFNGKKYEDICPSTHNMDVPIVGRKDFPLVDISDDGYAHLLTDEGDIREDLKVPEGDLGKEIKSRYENGEEFMVTVLKAVDEEAIIATKNTANK